MWSQTITRVTKPIGFRVPVNRKRRQLGFGIHAAQRIVEAKAMVKARSILMQDVMASTRSAGELN